MSPTLTWGVERRWRKGTTMRDDVSGWVTRLSDDEVHLYKRTGAWKDVTLADCARRQAVDMG